ncbi:MAG TPA: HEAT repeat domain-containing protein [Bryobacteraceae bacterium]|nr:HEAT repeat domain-containing protein [Bryobacteraceae bacterium]
MTRSLAFVAAVLATGCLRAEQPSIVNAKLQTVQVSGALSKTIESVIKSTTGPLWIGYTMPAPSAENHSCCWSNGGRTGCGLEGRMASPVPPTGPIRLEGSSFVSILLRADGGEIRKVRSYGLDCPLDGGGLPVYWLSNVQPTESIAYLEGIAATRDEGALHAISMHKDPAADHVLLRLARSGSTSKVRGQGLFWIAHRASREAARAITEAVDNDPDTEVKKKAVFALSQLPKEEGVPLLIQVARTHVNPAVRKQAMFWLGQSNDARAIQFFEQILLK